MNFMSTKNGVATNGIPKQFTPTSAYTRVDIDIDAAAGTDGLAIQVSNPGGPVNSCFLVDDISIVKVAP